MSNGPSGGEAGDASLSPAVYPGPRGPQLQPSAPDPHSGFGEPSSGGEVTFEWRRYVAAVLRHKWLILLAVLVGGAGGAGLARFRPPMYEARATIVAAVSAPGPAPISTGQLLSDYAWIDLMLSFAVLDQAVRDLRLYVEYKEPGDSLLFGGLQLGDRFAPGEYELAVSADGNKVTLSRGGAPVETVSAGDSIGRPAGFAWQPRPELFEGGRRIRFSVLNPRDIATRLSQDLRIRTDRDGAFLHIRLGGVNPYRIASTVNAVLDRFVEVAADIKRRQLSERVAILKEQLANAERNLTQAENALESFRVATITLPSERAMPIAPGLEVTQDPVFGSFFDMQVQLEGLQRDRETVERILAGRVRDDWNPLALEVVGQVQASSELSAALQDLATKQAELRALELQFTAQHPQVIRLREAITMVERTTIPQLAGRLVVDLASREEELRSRLSSASAELRQVPPRLIEEARLARDVEIAENLYNTLQSRFEESRLAEVSSIPDVSVLDPAVVPQRPVQDEGPRLLLLGLLGGFGLGVVGALVLDRLDQRVRYPEQVADGMGMPILGVVPHVRAGRNGGRDRDRVPVVEAFRGIRLNVLHAHGAGKVIVLVTSPSGGDGKSFVASNLALAFADAGLRTVLVDADTRKGTQHRVLSLQRKPGLTDHLAGKARLDTIVQETQYGSLHFVGGGTRMAGAPEMLTGPGMLSLLADLKNRYEAIVLDSPPLGAGVDAYALASVTGSVLLVLRTGKTDRSEAEAKLDILERFPVRLLGAVLNDVREGGAYGGYRSYQYYMPGYDYEIEPEEEGVGAAKPLGRGTGSAG